MAVEARLLVADIEALAAANDLAELENAVATLASAAREGLAAPSPPEAHRALNALRRKRQFPLLIQLAEALAEKGVADVTVRRLHAQALIDSIRPQDPVERYDAAIKLLGTIIADAPPDSREHREAQGLTGRAWKQLYVDKATRPPAPEHVHALQQAIGAYGEVARQGDLVRDHWHFINFIALTARAERDGVYPNHDVASRDLADLLVARLETSAGAPDADIWTLASLGEANVALGRFEAAEAAYQRYLQGAGTDAFELFSSLRQLREVWQLPDGTGGGVTIVKRLEARLAEVLGRQATLAPSDVARLSRLGETAAAPDRIETRPAEAPEHAGRGVLETSVTPAPALLTFRLLLEIIDRVAAVGLVRDRYQKRHVGTGFLVKGRELHGPLGDDVFLLTNSHVLGRLAGARYTPRQVEVEFTDRNQRMISLAPRDEDIVWESRVDQLDATLLRLKGVPSELQPLQLIDEAELPDDLAHLGEADRECLIAGHLGDLQLSVGIQPYRILDLGWRERTRPEHIYLHHDAPTRDGSSGSPLFSRDWRVIALHRAGTEERSLLPALGGRLGDRVAKIAVSINAIRRACARDLAGAAAAADEALPFLQDEQLLERLRNERVEEEELAQYVEWDPDRSEPYNPVLRRRANADGTVPQNAMTDVWWSAVATTASVGFRARRNYGFKRKEKPGAGLTLLSDGDSWFQFPVPGIADTIDHLRTTHAVYCHAVAGSVLQASVARAHERIIPSIKAHKPDAVLLSGGGNDILGFEALGLFVAPYRDGAEAESLIKPLLASKLDELEGYYSAWAERILEAAPEMRIFCHGYDWSLPEPGGRWLDRPLASIGIRDPALQRRIVRIIIDRFNERMSRLESRFAKRLFHVDCRGAVGLDRRSWWDELHPRSAGFARVAGRFNRRIVEAFTGDERVVGIA